MRTAPFSSHFAPRGDGEAGDAYSAAWARALKCRGTRPRRGGELLLLLAGESLLLLVDHVADDRVRAETGPPYMM